MYKIDVLLLLHSLYLITREIVACRILTDSGHRAILYVKIDEKYCSGVVGYDTADDCVQLQFVDSSC
jgi:hypothetical protein